jgi:hypothetical protein
VVSPGATVRRWPLRLPDGWCALEPAEGIEAAVLPSADVGPPIAVLTVTPWAAESKLTNRTDPTDPIKPADPTEPTDLPPTDLPPTDLAPTDLAPTDLAPADLSEPAALAGAAAAVVASMRAAEPGLLVIDEAAVCCRGNVPAHRVLTAHAERHRGVTTELWLVGGAAPALLCAAVDTASYAELGAELRRALRSYRR